MGDGKTEQFARTLADIEARWGKGSILTLHEMTSNAHSVTATGITALDELLGGHGIPHGQITEFLGRPTAGMIPLALSLLAQGQARGGRVVYLDVGHTFNVSAAVGYGVTFDTLLVVRPVNFDEALDIATELVSHYKVELVVFSQTVDPLAKITRIGATIKLLDRLVNAARRSSCAFICLTPLYGANHLATPFQPYAGLRLHLECVRWIRSRRVVVGYEVCATVLKDKVGGEHRQVTFPLHLNGSQKREKEAHR